VPGKEPICFQTKEVVVKVEAALSPLSAKEKRLPISGMACKKKRRGRRFYKKRQIVAL
jgi:hypothetical protein